MVHAVEVRPWVTAAETSPLPAGGRGTIKSTRVSWMRGLLNLVQRWPEMKGSPYVGIKKTKAFHFASAKNMVVGVSFLTHLRYCQKRTYRSFQFTHVQDTLVFFIVLLHIYRGLKKHKRGSSSPEGTFIMILLLLLWHYLIFGKQSAIHKRGFKTRFTSRSQQSWKW